MGNCLIGFLLESVILLVFPQEIRQKEFIMQARQGDIFFKTVKNVPKNLKKKTDNI